MLVDVVIPTIPGREESLDRCIDSYLKNTPKWREDLNIIVVQDSPSSGEGWIAGLELAESDAPFVHFTNDDLELIDKRWLDACMETTRESLLPCPLVFNADCSVQSAGGFMGMSDNLRSDDDFKDRDPVDFTTVPFMSKTQHDLIGMIPIHYSSDVWVSYRGRQLGIETELRTSYCFVHHNHEVGRGAGMNQGLRSKIDHMNMFQHLIAAQKEDEARA